MNPSPAILIVDDDEIFRAAMRQILTVLGYRVLELPSGVGVRAMVEREQPVLCLIDLIMADREGMETLGELHALAHPPKLVAVSSNLQYLSMTKQLGADAILTKPVTRERLEAILKELLPD
jgi:two-component system chemotaxis response regulator CheY/two-component system response regulator AtoC